MTATVTRTRRIDDPQVRESLWRIYTEAFGASTSRSVQDQICYDERSFEEALTDDFYLKFYVSIDGTPSGFVLATNDLERAAVAYINPDFFRAREPDACREGRLYYFTAIAIDPKHQKDKGLFFLLIEDITKFIDGVGGIVAFDSSDETGTFIPDMIERATLAAQAKNGLRTNRSSYETVGGQRYFIQKLRKE